MRIEFENDIHVYRSLSKLHYVHNGLDIIYVGFQIDLFDTLKKDNGNGIVKSLRCSLNIACQRCSNYIFILDLIVASVDWAKTTETGDEKHFNFGM